VLTDRMMLFLLVGVRGDSWSLGRREVTESTAVGLTLTFLESSILGTTSMAQSTLEEILLKTQDPERYGCVSLLRLLGPAAKDRSAAAAAVEGFLSEGGCTFCQSLLGFFASEGFWRTYGNSSGSDELLLKIPALASPLLDDMTAQGLYKAAMDAGAKDPLSLLGYLTSLKLSAPEALESQCEVYQPLVGSLADRSLENCGSVFPRPKPVRDLENIDSFGVAEYASREDSLWLLLSSGDVLVPEDPDFQREMARQASEVLRELRARDPDTETSRVAQALESYLPGAETQDLDSTTHMRNLLELIKRNQVVLRYNQAINRIDCVDSLELLSDLVLENNRFARLVHALFVWHWQEHRPWQAYWSALMLGKMGSAPGLLNAALVASAMDPLPVEELSRPLDYMRLRTTGESNVTCPASALLADMTVKRGYLCHSQCLQTDCQHLVISRQGKSLNCQLFSSCDSLISSGPGKIFDRIPGCRDSRLSCWLLRGVSACDRRLYEMAANITGSLEAFSWLSRDAWAKNDRATSLAWSLEGADRGSEEARLDLALADMYEWPGHPVNESRALRQLWELATEPEPPQPIDVDGLFAMDLDVALLAGTDMGQQIVELLDIEVDLDDKPWTLPRRVAALACYLYFRSVRLWSLVQHLAPWLVTAFAVSAAATFLVLRR